MYRGIALLLVSLAFQTAYAEGEYILGTGFTAPTVTDRTKIYQPEVGEIIYDSTADKFYGLDKNSAWQHLGSSGGGSQVIASANINTNGTVTNETGGDWISSISWFQTGYVQLIFHSPRSKVHRGQRSNPLQQWDLLHR